MAGDWIKVQQTTPDKPEVWAIADELDIDPDAVFGKLFRVWVWFDVHTENGHAPSVTKKTLDRLVGVTGFTESMIKAGWMNQGATEIMIPNFERHNGKTAKNRGLAQKRKVTERSRSQRDNSVTREEKRRDNNNCAFDTFWDAYPRKQGKKKALTAFSRLSAKDQAAAIEDCRVRYQGTDRHFIPYPTTYIHGARWNDEVEPGGKAEDAGYGEGCL